MINFLCINDSRFSFSVGETLTFAKLFGPFLFAFWMHSSNVWKLWNPQIANMLQMCKMTEKTTGSLSWLPISLLALEQFIHQKPHSMAPPCKTPSVSFFFSHTFGPGPSHATPLAVLVEVGLPYWKLAFCLNPSSISKEDTWTLSRVS